MRATRLLAVACLLGALVVPPLRAEPVEVAREGAAIYPVQGERSLRVEGFTGSILARTGREGEVRFLSTVPGQEDERPVVLWRDGETLILRPEAARKKEPHDLEFTIPPGFDLSLAAHDAEVKIAGLQGSLDVEGKELTLDATGVTRGASLELEGGAAGLNGFEGTVRVHAERADVVVGRPQGFVSVTADGGSVSVSGAADDVELDLTNVELEVDGTDGAFTLDARGGKAKVAGLEGGGRFSLEGTPLYLKECKGEVEVATDSAVSFEEMEAAIHVDGYGADVRGRGNEGLVEAKTDHAVVALEGIAGPVRVQGDGLRVSMKKIGGELLVYATASTVFVDGASAPVDLENDFGDVTVKNAAKKVTVTSRGGTVRLTGMNGPLQVSADGDLVEVGWVSLNRQENSSIRNEGGDVRMTFARQGGGRVEAMTHYGRVESDLPWIRVTTDGNRAVGYLNRRRRPTVRIEASGDIYLVPTAGASP